MDAGEETKFEDSDVYTHCGIVTAAELLIAKGSGLPTAVVEYDVFISYRDASERELTQRFYDRLTSDGWKVWFDKVSIVKTVNWRKAFMIGVMKSKMIVIILSTGAIKHVRKCKPKHFLF